MRLLTHVMYMATIRPITDWLIWLCTEVPDMWSPLAKPHTPWLSMKNAAIANQVHDLI